MKKTVFFQNRKCESYFGLNFQMVCRNWANKMALESWWKSASSIYLMFFLIPYYLKVIWKTVKLWAKCIFMIFFQTVCRIDANDTALESYVKCATFSYRNVFLIPYSLKMNSNTVKFDFERDCFKKLVEIWQIIYRWIAIENAKVSHVERFLYFATVQD